MRTYTGTLAWSKLSYSTDWVDIGSPSLSLFQIAWRPPTPLFPRKREGEFCSFLRHSVRFLAEGGAGPARICNAGAGCRDTKVAPRGRGGQVDGAGSLSRVFTATGCPQGTPLRMHRGPPCLEVGFPSRGVGRAGGFETRLPWVRVARMCVCFKRGGEIAGLGRIAGEKWCRRGDDVGRVWGWMRQGWERVARQGDTFFGYGGASGSGLGEGVRPGCALGRPGDIGKAIGRTQGDGRRFRVGRGGRLFARETVLGSPSNLKQARRPFKS